MTSCFHIPRLRARLFLITALAAWGWGFPAPAATSEVIVVKSADLKPYQEALKGLIDASDVFVREITLRDGEGPEKLRLKAAEAVVAIGTAAFKKVRTIKDVPVVHVMTLPAVSSSFLNGNISGVSLDLPPEAYLSSMKELFPRAKKIALVYDPRYTGAFVADVVKSAKSIGMELLTRPVHDPAQVPVALRELQEKPDILWLLPDPTVITPEIVAYQLQYSFEKNVPLFSFARKYVEMGAVASLEGDPYDMGRQAGEIVNLLAADQAHTVRVYARKSHLAVNTKMAEKMGLSFGRAVLKKGERVE